MFFFLSKTVGFFAVPSNLLMGLALLGVVLMGTRLARGGRRMTVTAVLLLAVVGWSPLGNALMLPLEQRFLPWTAGAGEPAGIIVLGGAIGPSLSVARGTAALNESAERMTAIAELARRFPQARIVFTGGSGALIGDRPDEARFALPLLESFGIPASRIALESASRDTWENATMTKALISPRPGERWLLVTSAHHMPRAVGCFRRAGFPVEPYPVDWRTAGVDDLLRPFEVLSGGLGRTDVAMREWIGLLVYWITDRTSALFPGPEQR
jgi:uncharacterized SAM-binding protein YcdF (DUF218 family)